MKIMERMLRAVCCIAFVVLLQSVGRGSGQDSSCLNKVSACLRYLNGSEDPPDSCCEPLKSLIESDAECLCSLLSNRGTRQAENAGINVTQAQQLPARCGQHVNPLSCLTSSPGPTNSEQNSATKFMHVSNGIFMIIIFWSIIARV